MDLVICEIGHCPIFINMTPHFVNYDVLHYTAASLFISCITYGLLLNATLPIWYEMTVEGVYPVAEGITTGALNWMFNFTGLVFLFVMMIPDIGRYRTGLMSHGKTQKKTSTFTQIASIILPCKRKVIGVKEVL